MSRGNVVKYQRGDFDENSPRPPVPGEETVYPLKSTTSYSQSVHAPLGYEPEGRCRETYHEGTRSPPACIMWARSLQALLDDTEGVELFKMYLEQEGKQHADALLFYFACNGVKNETNRETRRQYVKAVHKKYITPGHLGIDEDLRREVTARVRQGCNDKDIFDAACNDVIHRMNLTTYPNFLKSDIYLKYVQESTLDSLSGSGSGSGSSSSSGGRDPSLMGVNTLLPTLHEDSELVMPPDPLPLTKDMLAKTQGQRAFDYRPKPEAFAGLYLQNGTQQGIPRAYSSYNPVSRQDSELQSLSSDARTDSDTMSCAEVSMDGSSLNPCKRYHQRQLRAIKENANQNRDSIPNPIPRTTREGHGKPMEPQLFARILTEKLKQLQKDWEIAEMVEARMTSQGHSSRVIVDAANEIRSKLQQGDVDNGQSILDQHVSRVWADRTPCRSPGRPKSPEQRQKVPPNPYQTRQSPRYPRKEKDVFSNFSSDSGNVYDFPECSDSSRHFPKSKSVPECVDAGHDPRMRGLSRRGSSRNTLTDLTDSGVSVVSDSANATYGTVPIKDGELLKAWIKQSSRMKPSMQQTRHVRRERSGSLERNVLPGDSMSMSQPQHTTSQLEETRRRLIEDDSRGKVSARQRALPSSKTHATVEASISNQSTLKTSEAKSENCTTATFYFCDEEFPYRTKIHSLPPITLRQFKEILPRRGSYRYFFKTECDEVGAKAIQQEVSDENEFIPLWEGKVHAQVKPFE